MISFITAARTTDEAETLRRNLDTVFPKGCGYDIELLSQVGYDSIFSAYNDGASKAEGTALCFVHTDITFLCNHLCFEAPIRMISKPFCGWIGAAGSTVLEESAIWWSTNHKDLRGMVAHPGDNEFDIQWNHWPWGQAALFGQVVVLDGCFLMIDKQKFERIGGFDAATYDGFHFYDVEATAKAHLQGFRNICCPVPLLHRSPGRPNEKWHENRTKFLTKHGKQLPIRL